MVEDDAIDFVYFELSMQGAIGLQSGHMYRLRLAGLFGLSWHCPSNRGAAASRATISLISRLLTPPQ
jgi:hypothetical protein